MLKKGANKIVAFFQKGGGNDFYRKCTMNFGCFL